MCVAGDHNRKSCLKHPATSKLYEVALLHFWRSRKKLLSGSPRRAKPVQEYPQTLFALKQDQSPKSWDWNDSKRPNAGAAASRMDLASSSEGKQQLLKNFLKIMKKVNQLSVLRFG